MIEDSTRTPAALPLRKWFADGFLGRIFRNAGALLGGKAVAGALSLGTLAVTARGLGPELFGTLILIHSYVKLVGGLTKFQSWQAVIHFGATCLEEKRPDDLQRLIKFTTLLDLASAVIGMALAMALVGLVGETLGWDASTVDLVMVYSLLIAVTIKATPIGVLRLFDRFKLIALQTPLGPTVGLIGVSLAYASDGGLVAYLAAWFAAGAVESAALIALGWRELGRQGLLRNLTVSLRGLVKPHPGLWRFVWAANIFTSLSAAASHLITLLLGWLLGPTAAGLFKIANQFASVLVVPAAILRRTIYPEFAKLTAKGEPRLVRKLMLRAGLISGSAAVVVVLVLMVIAEPLINLIVGPAYGGAADLLVLIAAASAVMLYGFAIEPVFFALGRPGIMLRLSVITAALNLVLIFLLVAEYGLIGAGMAALASTLVSVGLTTFIALKKLRKKAARP
ncbi:MAG: oligosaccharide flippase family protein [Alphaproteobacteria bacterium]